MRITKLQKVLLMKLKAIDYSFKGNDVKILLQAT